MDWSWDLKLSIFYVSCWSSPEASFYLQIERCAGVAKQSCSVRLEEDRMFSGPFQMRRNEAG